MREVFEVLRGAKTTGYTTVLKLRQIMAEKRLGTRDESERAHRYEARRREEQTQRQLVGDLLRRAFDGSAKKLVLQALASEQASTEDLNEIRRMLDEFEKRGGR